MIRKLEVADSPWVRATMQTLAARMYPELIPDVEKMHWLVRDAVNSDKHYANAIGPKGEPKAILIARVQNNLWATKKSATVLCWYSEQPGAGAKLLRDFKKWCHKDHHILMAGLSFDWHGNDFRPLWLASRIGFKARGGAYVYLPHGDKSGLV